MERLIFILLQQHRSEMLRGDLTGTSDVALRPAKVIGVGRLHRLQEGEEAVAGELG